MLSYRKSQQVSLTEKLKKKNVIHIFGVSGSGTTMARFCLSAFVRVATYSNDCTVYMGVLCLSAFVRVATYSNDCTVYMGVLCLSAFVRVATLVVFAREPMIDLCLSAFVRVATPSDRRLWSLTIFATAHSCGLRHPQKRRIHSGAALPQRIRAGCDPRR